MPDDQNPNPVGSVPKPSFVVDSPPADPMGGSAPVATENIETPPPPIVTQSDNNPQADLGIPPVVTTPKPKGKSKKGMVAAILGILLLIGGLGAGVFLVQRQQNIKEKAAETQAGRWCEGVCATEGGQCITDGCQTRDGNKYEMVRYHCDTVSPNGCAGQEVERQYTSSMSFKENCGSEQIDVYGAPDFPCPNPPCGNWAHKDYAEDCGGTPPTPPAKTPTPAPTPTITPTPKPLACGDECIPNQAVDPCPGNLSCEFFAAPNIFVCQNPQCLFNSGQDPNHDCVCTGQTPTPTPTPTLKPTPSAPPGGGQCNSNCVTDADCKDMSSSDGSTVDLFCYQPMATPCPTGMGCPAVNPPKVCRNSACPTDTDCVCPAGYFQCLNLKAYDTNWVLLSVTDLSKLKAGDKVRFTVAGDTTYGKITKAKFSVNNVCMVTTLTKPGPTICSSCSSEFYIEYTIPYGVTSFLVDARLYVEGMGWMGKPTVGPDTSVITCLDQPEIPPAGQMCGGFQGTKCPDGYECIYEGGGTFAPYPDASGTCQLKSTKK